MSKHMISRRGFAGMMGAMGAASALALSGCGSSGGSSSGSAAGSASASAPSGAASGSAAAGDVLIGTLATEDILPMWVAEEDGLFENGVTGTTVQFQSAAELIAGVASGDVDMAMTDIMVTAGIFASGTDVQMEWVTLGATPAQGRFGIMAGPDSKAKTLADLAGVPIGVGSNTILEYVMDRLMEDAGVLPDQVVVQEIQKLPVRYQAMLSGEVQAAALPASLLALGEHNGCTLIADDTKGENISQSVMIARADFANGADGPAAIEAMKAAWDAAAGRINANPETYRELLVQRANLSEEIAETYPISDSPLVQLPTSAMVEPVLAWMQEKGYLTTPLTYDQTTGVFSK